MELADRASGLSEQLSSAPDDGGGAHQGSAHRKLNEELRREVLTVRGRLFELGIYEPVLVRFDTATVTQASNAEIAGRLAAVAAMLRGSPE